MRPLARARSGGVSELADMPPVTQRVLLRTVPTSTLSSPPRVTVTLRPRHMKMRLLRGNLRVDLPAGVHRPVIADTQQPRESPPRAIGELPVISQHRARFHTQPLPVPHRRQRLASSDTQRHPTLRTCHLPRGIPERAFCHRRALADGQPRQHPKRTMVALTFIPELAFSDPVTLSELIKRPSHPRRRLRRRHPRPRHTPEYELHPDKPPPNAYGHTDRAKPLPPSRAGN
jgi:hypothetical protein